MSTAANPKHDLYAEITLECRGRGYKLIKAIKADPGKLHIGTRD